MCLVSFRETPYIAKKDIVCYKVMDLRRDEYYTPVQGFPVDKEIIEGKKNLVAEGCEDIISRIRKKNFIPINKYFPFIIEYAIGGGFIHAFLDKECALDPFKGNILGNSCFKCVIPKGTKYFVGEGSKDICTKEIKFVEKIF
jgi:hypothetical protein